MTISVNIRSNEWSSVFEFGWHLRILDDKDNDMVIQLTVQSLFHQLNKGDFDCTFEPPAHLIASAPSVER